jgi:IgA Peptidase M64
VTINDGQILGTTKIVDHGSPAQRWNMVILGDGYRAAELNKYQNDVQNFVNVLQATAPFTRAWGAINVFRVDVSSTESGADDPVACADGSVGSGDVKATYFDSTYCFGGSPRRRLYGDEQNALSASRAQVPGARVHQTMVIVNALQYGGGGGAVAWFSTDPASAEIGIHEMAHSFFGLKDEYGDTINNYNGPEPPEPNITTDTNRATTKWRKLIQPATPVANDVQPQLQPGGYSS